MELAAECASEVSSIVENMFMQKGYSRSEARSSFNVSLDSVSDKEKRITLAAELSYDEFSSIEQQLDAAVQSVDKNAYFDAETSGRYVAVLDFSESNKAEDAIFNDQNIRPVVERVLKQLDKQFDDTFSITDLYYNAEGYYAPDDQDDNDDLVRIYVEASGNKYDTMAYVDMYKSETLSVSQMKADLTDELYRKLVNAMVSK
jgi:hypothetical protein